MLTLTTTEILLSIAGYLLGSISSAILVCKILGLPDPRTQGSGNPGATNVMRLGGKRAAAVTLFGDTLKGFIPVIIGQLMGVSITGLGVIGFSAFIGHLYPVFFGFRGGKGVATAIGFLMAATWKVGLANVLTWVIVAKVFRISSLSALTAFLLTPLYAWWLVPGEHHYLVVVTIISVILFWRHRSNIRKLIEGTED
jgi:glycerol-3-phosphate acyltransferase PlsY